MEELTERERDVVATIDRVGWAVFQIRPGAEDRDQRWFAYTAGLTVTHSWPELICFGLDAAVMGNMLNNAVQELQQSGREPVHGLTLSKVLSGFPVRLETFPREHYPDHLGWALWFAEHRAQDSDDVTCLQIIWPDADGRFPSEPHCDAHIREAQMPMTFEE